MSLNRRVWCLVSLAAAIFPAALGQVDPITTVLVGANGTFFEPPTVSVTLNGTVRFSFVGPAHSVTQTSFDNPCFLLPGGFSSGIHGVQNVSVAAPPFWDLRITNVSEPIWFYCPITAPDLHCASGMVGVINPPSIEAYDQFLAAAKAVEAIPTAFPPNALSGQGAVATAFPASPSPLPTTTPTITMTPTITTTPTGVSSSNSGIIRGSVVRVFVAVVAAVLLQDA